MQFNLAVLAAAFAAVLPSAFAAPAARQIGPPGVPIHPAGSGSKCLDVAGANFANGTKVQVYDCNGSDAQRWIVNSGATTPKISKTNGTHTFCLDAGSKPFNNGDLVHIWECKPEGVDAPQQKWYYIDDNNDWHFALENQNPGFCLDLKDGSLANGNPVQIWGCSGTNPNQKWTFNHQ